MKNKCGVCHEEFDSDELLQKHEIIHITKSILNKPLDNSESIVHLIDNDYKIINLDKIYNKEKIEELIESKIKKINNTEKSIDARIFIEQFKKINRKNPFCHLPSFIEDFMNGVSGVKLVKKYHIDNSMELRHIVKEILGFVNDRHLFDKDNNALENNLKISEWKEKYNTIKKNCKFFKDEINQTIFYNMLQAKIILSLMDKPLEKNEILSMCNNLKNEYDRFRFIDKNLECVFNELLDIHLDECSFEILHLLLDEEIIKRSRKNPKQLEIDLSIDNIKKNIIVQLSINGNKLKKNLLKTMIKNEYPALKLIPGFGVFTVALIELQNEKTIYEEYDLSRGDSEIFLGNQYLQMQQKITILDSGESIIPFKGRKITPERFVNELLELDKGDFNDPDDQVTRLAGLVLAESVKIQSPREEIDDFDFAINISNYQFRPEQLDAIVKLDFKINSEIIHVKVMIDEVLNLKKYNELREKLPNDEQGVVITFKKIPLDVKKILDNDSTLQIIDEAGVKIWVSITSRIPARVNSISKIYEDPLSKLKNKIVKVNSVFYETGIALVSIIPEMKEETVLVRSLEEISFNEDSLNSYNVLSKNYFNFLKKLGIVAPDTFEVGLNTPIKSIEKKWVKNYQKNRMELVENAWIVEFDHVKVELDLNQYRPNSIFKCGCYYRVDQEHSYTLCKHIVASLNQITIQNFLQDGWNSKTMNLMERAMILFLKMSTDSSIQRIAIDLNEKELSIFKNYLENYADLIESKQLDFS